jgi:hypothetical protein
MSKARINIEFNIGEYFNRLIYAVLKDMDLQCNDDELLNLYNEFTYQNYNNLTQNRENRLVLKTRFTLSVEAKQYLTMLFHRLIEEAKNIDINDNDTIEVIVNRLDEYNDESYSKCMYTFSQKYIGSFSQTLLHASEPRNYLPEKLSGDIPALAGRYLIIAQLIKIYDDFLKTLAYLIGIYQWYNKTTISGKMILVYLTYGGMNQFMLDELITKLRPKKQVKRKPKGEKVPVNAKTHKAKDKKIEKEVESDNELDI